MISFAEKHPELVGEWAEENEIRPENISYGSNKKVIWNGICGHSWEASIKNRGNRHGCPYCSGNKVLKGVNDLATLHPELVDEWDASNMPLMPDMVSRKADREITWKCLRCGQTWRSRIADRTDGHGCPVCAGERLVQGINDFATEYPELASEWSDKNTKKPTEVWSKSRENVWWHCKVCGAEYQAVIDSRVKGRTCPECMKNERLERVPFHNMEEECLFKRNAVAFYADQNDEPVLIGSDEIIGVPLDAYFPNRKAAILYSSTIIRDCLVRRENAKNWLCLNAGIKLFRFLPKDGNEYDNCVCITLPDRTMETFGMGLQVMFDRIGIPADVDIIRDVIKIKGFSKPGSNSS